VGTQLVPDDPNEVPSIGSLLDPVKAQAMQARKVETYKAKRARTQREKHAAAKAALAPAIDQATAAMESKRFDDKTNEEIADLGLRRLLKVIVLGGEAFTPTTLAEVNDTLKTLSAVAKAESLRKGKIKDDVPEDDTPMAEAVKALSRVKRRLELVADGIPG
jgi:hypothetical protein